MSRSVRCFAETQEHVQPTRAVPSFSRSARRIAGRRGEHDATTPFERCRVVTKCFAFVRKPGEAQPLSGSPRVVLCGSQGNRASLLEQHPNYHEVLGVWRGSKGPPPPFGQRPRYHNVLGSSQGKGDTAPPEQDPGCREALDVPRGNSTCDGTRQMTTPLEQRSRLNRAARPRDIEQQNNIPAQRRPGCYRAVSA